MRNDEEVCEYDVISICEQSEHSIKENEVTIGLDLKIFTKLKFRYGSEFFENIPKIRSLSTAWCCRISYEIQKIVFPISDAK